MTIVNVAYAPTAGDLVQRMGAPIWENLYEMRVPYVETVSADMLKRAGLPDTGNRHLNRQMHQDLVNVVITIDAMVEYFKRGVTVNFRNPADTGAVYTIVNNYLLAWRQQVENGLNLGNVPVDDLLALDRFVEALYPVAVRYGAAPRNTGSLFANLLSGNGAFLSRGSIFAKKDEKGNDKPLFPEKHDSHAGELAKSIARLRDNW